MQQLYAVINSGFAVSGDIDLTQRRLFGVAVPVITSGDLAIQGNIDTTSATFYRLLETRSPGSGDLRFATGPGSRMVLLPEDIPTPAYIRLELITTVGSPQADTRTLTLLTRPR